MLQWYSLIRSSRHYFALSFDQESTLLLAYSSFNFLIFSLMKSIFSYRQALFSVRTPRSSSYNFNVSSMFLTINLSQNVSSTFLTDLISLKFSIPPSSSFSSSFSLSPFPSYLFTFSYSSSDSSSIKVLLCIRLLSSAYLPYFLRMVLRKSLAFLRPYFEFVSIAAKSIIGINDHIKTTSSSKAITLENRQSIKDISSQLFIFYKT